MLAKTAYIMFDEVVKMMVPTRPARDPYRAHIELCLHIILTSFYIDDY